MAAVAPKQERHFLSHELELSIPTGRVRQVLDEGALNYKQEKQSEEALRVLLEIRQKGGPEKPVAPESLPRGTKDVKLRAEHDAAREAYLAKFKEWQSFRSEDYKTLHNSAELIIILQKIHKILTRPADSKEKKDKEKEKKSREQREAKDKKTIEELAKRLNDEAPVNVKRVREFIPKGFKARVKGVNLKDPKSIQTRIDELKAEDKRVQRVLELYAIRKTKVRMSTGSTVALSATLQKIIEDIADHACRAGIQRGKHMIKNDHIFLNNKYKELSTYPLWADLPHMKQLEAREARRSVYEGKVKVAKRNALLKHNRIVADLKKQYADQKEALREAMKEHKFVFKPKSFEDHEADQGYARKTERKDEDGNPKKVKRPEGMVQSFAYTWKFIDFEESESENIDSFVGPVGDICDVVVGILVDNGDANEGGIRVSAGLKHFLNNICLDFIYAIAVQLELMLKVSKSKTVTPEMVRAAVSGRLLHGQSVPHAQYSLTSEQAEVFRYVDDKIAACEQQIQTTLNQRKAKLEVEDLAQPKAREAPAAKASAADDEEEEEEEDEQGGEEFEDGALDDELEASPKTPAKVVPAKSPVKTPAKTPQPNGKAPAVPSPSPKGSAKK